MSLFLGLTSIPIHTNYATDETFISYIVTKTALQAVVCEPEFIKCFKTWDIPSLILVDNIDEKKELQIDELLVWR